MRSATVDFSVKLNSQNVWPLSLKTEILTYQLL